MFFFPLLFFVTGLLHILSFDMYVALQEAEQHTNRFDPNGHTRKIETKLQNTEKNKRAENVSAKSK